jgi:hypothetical protein
MRYDFPLAFLQFLCKYDQRQPSSTTSARVPFSEVRSRQEKLYVIAGSPIKTTALARGPRTAADRRHTWYPAVIFSQTPPLPHHRATIHHPLTTNPCRGRMVMYLPSITLGIASFSSSSLYPFSTQLLAVGTHQWIPAPYQSLH